MIPSDSLNSKFRSSLKDVKIFFSTCLSMHMLPVLFALMLIVIANKNTAVQAGNKSPESAASSGIAARATESSKPALVTTDVVAGVNFLFLHPTNFSQVVAIYKISRTVRKILR